MEANPQYEKFHYTIDPENIVHMYYDQELIWTSRAFRLHVQAEAQAKEFIEKYCPKDQSKSVTLKVQSLSVDANTLFGRKRNG